MVTATEQVADCVEARVVRTACRGSRLVCTASSPRLAGSFHRPKISWFIGAGGPVPITPGYVPYIVTTRSPRDFFSFPPMNPNDSVRWESRQ